MNSNVFYRVILNILKIDFVALIDFLLHISDRNTHYKIISNQTIKRICRFLTFENTASISGTNLQGIYTFFTYREIPIFVSKISAAYLKLSQKHFFFTWVVYFTPHLHTIY